MADVGFSMLCRLRENGAITPDVFNAEYSRLNSGGPIFDFAKVFWNSGIEKVLEDYPNFPINLILSCRHQFFLASPIKFLTLLGSLLISAVPVQALETYEEFVKACGATEENTTLCGAAADYNYATMTVSLLGD